MAGNDVFLFSDGVVGNDVWLHPDGGGAPVAAPPSYGVFALAGAQQFQPFASVLVSGIIAAAAAVVDPVKGRITAAPQEQLPARVFLWSGNAPLAEQPELYRRAIVGPQTVDVPRSVLRAPQPTETPRSDRLIVGRQEQATPASALRGPQPGETPRGAPLIARGQEQSQPASLTGPPAAAVAPQEPRQAGLVVGAQPPEQPRSLLARGPLEAVSQTPGATGAEIVEGHQRSLQVVRSWLWPSVNVPPADAPPGQQAVVPSQREAGEALKAWTWRGALPPEPSTPGATGAEIIEGHQKWLLAAAQARPWLLPSIAIPPSVGPTPSSSGAYITTGHQQALLYGAPGWFVAGAPPDDVTPPAPAPRAEEPAGRFRRLEFIVRRDETDDERRIRISGERALLGLEESSEALDRAVVKAAAIPVGAGRPAFKAAQKEYREAFRAAVPGPVASRRIDALFFLEIGIWRQILAVQFAERAAREQAEIEALLLLAVSGAIGPPVEVPVLTEAEILLLLATA